MYIFAVRIPIPSCEATRNPIRRKDSYTYMYLGVLFVKTINARGVVI